MNLEEMRAKLHAAEERFEKHPTPGTLKRVEGWRRNIRERMRKDSKGALIPVPASRGKVWL